MPPATRRPALRYKLREAAEVLGLGYTHFRELAVDRGEFTVVRDEPKFPKARIFIPADEIEAFAVGGIAGLREFRAKKGRK
jgi:hypothetical protein